MSRLRVLGRSQSAVSKSHKQDKKTMSGDDYDDDRYEIYSQGDEFGQSTNSKKGPPQPVIDDFMEKILAKKHEAMKERMKKRSKTNDLALQFTRLLITCAYNRHTLLKTYIRATKGKPEISHFRAVGQNKFSCFVPLKRPTRPGTFKVIFKNPRDFPSHKMLVCLDDPVSNLERLQTTSEWGHCVDLNGVVRPDLVLIWFNDGLNLICDLMNRNDVESQFNFRDMTCITNDDGVSTITISVTNEESETTEMEINIAPCLILDEVPKQFNIPPLFPSRRPYFELNTQFIHYVSKDLESGRELLFLQANLESLECACINGYEPNVACSWELNTELLEDLGLKFMREKNGDVNEEDLRFIFDQIIDNSENLFLIPPRVIHNCVLQLNRKLTGKIKARGEWFMELLKTILLRIRCTKCPAFFLPKLDLLNSMETETSALIVNELEKIIQDLESDPSLLLKYTGYDKDTDSDSEPEVDGDNDQTSEDGSEDECNSEKSEKSEDNPELENESCEKTDVESD